MAKQKLGHISRWKTDRRLRKLSVAVDDTELPTVPQATAQNIWEKAERLLNDPESISRSLGNDCAYMVVSQTSKMPHFVQVCTSEKIVCDEQCLMWRGHKLCSHTVAVAEHKLCHSFCIGFGNQSKNAIGHNTQREKVSWNKNRKADSKKWFIPPKRTHYSLKEPY